MWSSPLQFRSCRLLALAACSGALLVCSCVTQPETTLTEVGAPMRNRQRTFEQPLRSWQTIKRDNVVMQQRDFSCGAAALATLLQYHLGDSASEAMLLRELVKMLTPEEMQDRVKRGLSLTDLRRLAVRLKYQASIGRLEFDKLRASKVPLIVGIIVEGYNHFAVYRGMDHRYVYLADPARGNVRTPADEFRKQWQKNAILVVVKPGQAPRTHSLLGVRSDESFLGTLNDEYLRKRLTSKPRSR